MRILKPEITESGGSAILRARVTSRLGEEALWYSVPGEDAEALAPETADAFLLGLLPVAMALGEDLQVAAPVSQTLLFNINHGLKQLIKAQLPKLRDIRVIAEGTEEFTKRCGTVATGVSGGVDSSYTIAEHHLSNEVPETLRVRQLMFFNVGAHGDKDGDGSRVLFERRRDLVTELSDYVGLPLLTIDSNLGKFHELVDFEHQNTVTIRNVAAGMSVQRRISRYLIASGLNFANSMVGEARNMERANTFLLPLTRTERFDAIGVGGHMTRATKIERIGSLDFTKLFLNPCLRDVRNCGRCNKCISTQFVLEVIGLLDEYGTIFDRDVYEKTRSRYIAKICYAGPQGFTAKDIVQFARQRRFPIDVSPRLRAIQYLKLVERSLPTFVGTFRKRVFHQLRTRGNSVRESRQDVSQKRNYRND